MKEITSFFYCLLLAACLPKYVEAKSGWAELGHGDSALNANAMIRSITIDAAGNVYAAGLFTDAGGYRYVAKWNGSNWAELGTGANALNTNFQIEAITTDAAGNVYAAGNINNPTTFKYYVAKWNGITWAELGTGTNALNANGPIHTIMTDAAGNVYVAGAFYNAGGNRYVAKWNGTTWAELGTGANALNANWYIGSITNDVSGNIYAGGGFTNANGKYYVAKWNGVTWSELGTGANALNASGLAILSIIADSAGNIYAAGGFTNANGKYYVAKWNGTTWAELGSGANALNATVAIESIAIDASGNLYAPSAGTGGTKKYIAKWNGHTWAELGSWTSDLGPNDNFITSIATDTAGNVYAGGGFVNTDGKMYVARYTPPRNVSASSPNAYEGSFTLSPNPNNGHFTIRCQSDAKNIGQRVTIALYNILGQMVYSSEARPDRTDWSLDVWPGSEIVNGLYQLRLTSPGMNSVRNIVIER